LSAGAGADRPRSSLPCPWRGRLATDMCFSAERLCPAKRPAAAGIDDLLAASLRVPAALAGLAAFAAVVEAGLAVVDRARTTAGCTAATPSGKAGGPASASRTSSCMHLSEARKIEVHVHEIHSTHCLKAARDERRQTPPTLMLRTDIRYTLLCHTRQHSRCPCSLPWLCCVIHRMRKLVADRVARRVVDHCPPLMRTVIIWLSLSACS
jgi:hypothetical protein